MYFFLNQFDKYPIVAGLEVHWHSKKFVEITQMYFWKQKELWNKEE